MLYIQCLADTVHTFLGQQLDNVTMHLDSVDGRCYNSYQQELYSGSNDCNIVVWLQQQRQKKRAQQMIKIRMLEVIYS